MRPEWNPGNPFPWYQDMLKNAPVWRDAEGSVHVFSYESVSTVLSDYTRFSSNFGGKDDPHHPINQSLIATDPPRHRALRALVSQGFTPKTIQRLGPRIQDITDELLGALSGPDTDLIGALAYPLPVIVIAELLGVPVDDRSRFKRWSDAMVSGVQAAEEAQSVAAGTRQVDDPQREMAQYFQDMIAWRRKHPGPDLISDLLQATLEGEHLTVGELLGFCVLLLVAGNETTTNLIGNAVDTMLDHPESLDTVRQTHGDWGPLIEEVLRFRSPVQSMYRVCRVATQLEGIDLAPGDALVAWIGAANHDSAQFEHPEKFWVERSPNRHIAFGHGVHFCLGAPLARLEASIALCALYTRFPKLARAGESPRPVLSRIVYGKERLPIILGP